LPAIILEWDRQLGVSKGILLGQESAHRHNVVATAPDAHPHARWRVICFQKDRSAGTQLSISANGFAGPSFTAIMSPDCATVPCLDCTLQVGGDEAQRDALFLGAIAELMIFDRALATDGPLGITRYLKEKYLL
jgi:hypothetical protein